MGGINESLLRALDHLVLFPWAGSLRRAIVGGMVYSDTGRAVLTALLISYHLVELCGYGHYAPSLRGRPPGLVAVRQDGQYARFYGLE